MPGFYTSEQAVHVITEEMGIITPTERPINNRLVYSEFQQRFKDADCGGIRINIHWAHGRWSCVRLMKDRGGSACIRDKLRRQSRSVDGCRVLGVLDLPSVTATR